jgi:hypothetical protein
VVAVPEPAGVVVPAGVVLLAGFELEPHPAPTIDTTATKATGAMRRTTFRRCVPLTRLISASWGDLRVGVRANPIVGA